MIFLYFTLPLPVTLLRVLENERGGEKVLTKVQPDCNFLDYCHDCQTNREGGQIILLLLIPCLLSVYHSYPRFFCGRLRASATCRFSRKLNITLRSLLTWPATWCILGSNQTGSLILVVFHLILHPTLKTSFVVRHYVIICRDL